MKRTDILGKFRWYVCLTQAGVKWKVSGMTHSHAISRCEQILESHGFGRKQSTVIRCEPMGKAW